VPAWSSAASRPWAGPPASTAAAWCRRPAPSGKATDRPTRQGAGEDPGGLRYDGHAAGVVRRAGLAQPGMVAHPVVVRRQQHLHNRTGGQRACRLVAVTSRRRIGAFPDSQQPSTDAAARWTAVLVAGVEGQDRQWPRVRVGEHVYCRPLPSTPPGSSSPAASRAWPYASDRLKLGRDHQQPPPGRVTRTGNGEPAAPGQRRSAAVRCTAACRPNIRSGRAGPRQRDRPPGVLT
jgi:hypothetical protein